MKTLSFLTLILFLASCQTNTSTNSPTTNTGWEIEQENNEEISTVEETLTYSNINSPEIKQEILWLLQEAGIKEEHIEEFLGDISRYNTDIENTTLTSEWYTTVDGLEVTYDEETIVNLVDEKNFPFIGLNCRLTSYKLLEDLIIIETPDVEEAQNLSIDQYAIDNAGEWFLSQQQQKEFTTLFASIPTENTKDIQVHLKNIQNYWREKGISFIENDKISFVSVFFHNTLDDDLFIGHAGILLPYWDNKLAFIEKLSFQLPYQINIFEDRVELNDYLMRKYDISYNQPEARPFIMENGELMEGYRANTQNPGVR